MLVIAAPRKLAGACATTVSSASSPGNRKTGR
jgi:hypothetical protein